MKEDRSQEIDAEGFVRRLDEMLAHARFASVLETIGEVRPAGSISPVYQSQIVLARCRALLGLGRFREASETAEKKLEELYALRPEDKRALLEFHIAAGRAAWRIGRPARAEEHFRAAYHISRWEFEDTAGMLRTRNLLGL